MKTGFLKKNKHVRSHSCTEIPASACSTQHIDWKPMRERGSDMRWRARGALQRRRWRISRKKPHTDSRNYDNIVTEKWRERGGELVHLRVTKLLRLTETPAAAAANSPRFPRLWVWRWWSSPRRRSDRPDQPWQNLEEGGAAVWSERSRYDWRNKQTNKHTDKQGWWCWWWTAAQIRSVFTARPENKTLFFRSAQTELCEPNTAVL